MYIGQAVLDLSKLIMYRLRYVHLLSYAERLGGIIKVVAGDTDSFFLEVRGISVDNQLLPPMQADGLLDSSNYPHNHQLYSSVGKAALGRVKNECPGVLIQDAVFLRPKCYSLLLATGKHHKRAKGVQNCVLKTKIKHDDYIEVNCTFYNNPQRS